MNGALKVRQFPFEEVHKPKASEVTNIMVRIITIAILLQLMGAGMLPVDRALADDGPLTGAVVRCEPAVVAGHPGQQLTVGLYIENIADLYGVEMELSFNPAIAQVVDADPGTPGVQIQPLSGFLSPDFVVRRSADNVAGIIQYAATQVAPSPPVSGSGAVAAVTFQSVANGTFSMPFSDVLLSSIDGTPIDVTVLPCAVQYQPNLPCYDFDNDGIVDLDDLIAVAVRWPLTIADPDPDNSPVTPNYEPLYDLNSDGAITVIDIMMVAGRWQQSCG